MMKSLWILSILSMILISSFSYANDTLQAYGSEFYLNNTTFRFVGVNIRGLVHYGHGYPLLYPSISNIDDQINGVAAMGGKVIRIFAPSQNTTHQESAIRLKYVLDKMDIKGLKAILCLTDNYQTGYCPQGDFSYYSSQPGGYTLLDDSWFAGGFHTNYLPFVQYVVGQLKNHNAIFAWELGNELTDIKTPNNIINFTLEVASTIKSIDSTHLVTTGFISIDHTQIGETNGYSLYSTSYLDFITLHSYNGDDPAQNWAVHSRLAKPLLLEEYGWNSSFGNRTTNTQAQLNKWLDTRAARGFMQWGYQAQNYDIGDGDSQVGMDSYAFTDFNQMVSILSTRASLYSSLTTTKPSRLVPSGTNVARYSVGWSADSVYDNNNTGDKAYDGIIAQSSKWTSQGNSPPHWLALNLGESRIVNGFAIRMAGAEGEFIFYAFKNFQIQSATSFSGPWTTEFTVDNNPQFSNVYCLYNSPKSMQYVRIYITDSGIDNYARLPEFEVYDNTVPVRDWYLFD